MAESRALCQGCADAAGDAVVPSLADGRLSDQLPCRVCGLPTWLRVRVRARPDHNVAVFPQGRNEPMRICDVCGWYMICPTHRCRPAAGAAATALQQRFPQIKSTKLGYGTGHVTFEFNGGHAITFNVNSGGTFCVEGAGGAIFWLGAYSADDAATMIEALWKLSQTMKDVS